MIDSSFDLLSLFVSTAHAAGAAADQGAAAAPAMPQLNPKTMATQLFWLAVTFIALYVLMAKVALPKVSAVIDARAERIDADLSVASNSKSEAEQLTTAYSQSLDKARTEASSSLRAAVEATEKEVAKREMEAAALAANEAKAVEARISAAQRAAMMNVSVIAVDVATAAVHRLTGVGVTEADASKAVNDALENRRI
jgi:F-type H+-transporting ATPase subunit b